MSILEEADQFQLKESLNKTISIAKEIGFGDKDLSFYELLRFFDITSVEKLKNEEILRKVEIIYEFLKGSSNIIKAAMDLNSKLGNPLDLMDKLNQMYSYVYSLNLEKGFDKKKQIADEKLQKEIEEKKKKSEEIAEGERIRKKRDILEKIKRDEIMKAEDIRRKKNESRVNSKIQENMNAIENAKQPKPPEAPSVKVEF